MLGEEKDLGAETKEGEVRIPPYVQRNVHTEGRKAIGKENAHSSKEQREETREL